MKGCTQVRITSQKARGVRYSQAIPQVSLDENGSGEISGHQTTYDGVSCWAITERGTMQGSKYVQVFTVKQDNLVILEHSFFSGNGQLMTRTQYQNLKLAPKFPETVFKIPADTILSYAYDLQEMEEMLSDVIAQEKIDLGIGNPVALPESRRHRSWFAHIKDDPLDFLLFLATYFGLPIAGLCFLLIGFLKWKKK